jgi:hypothetical protein
MHDDADQASAPLRARIRALAAQGVPETDIRQLCGVSPNGALLDATSFKQTYARELSLGAAEANAEVSKALYAQATSGKVPTITLAWAKHRLGWSESKEDSADATANNSQPLVAALQQLLDELAATKAAGGSGAAALADHGTAQSATSAD